MKKIICSIMMILCACTLVSIGNVHAAANNENKWVEATIVMPESNSLVSPLADRFPCCGSISGNGVNLRATASFNGRILESMYQDETVYINYAKSSGYVNGYRWLYVKREKTGTIGYVYEKYVLDQS